MTTRRSSTWPSYRSHLPQSLPDLLFEWSSSSNSACRCSAWAFLSVVASSASGSSSSDNSTITYVCLAMHRASHMHSAHHVTHTLSLTASLGNTSSSDCSRESLKSSPTALQRLFGPPSAVEIVLFKGRMRMMRRRLCTTRTGSNSRRLLPIRCSKHVTLHRLSGEEQAITVDEDEVRV